MILHFAREKTGELITQTHSRLWVSPSGQNYLYSDNEINKLTPNDGSHFLDASRLENSIVAQLKLHVLVHNPPLFPPRFRVAAT